MVGRRIDDILAEKANSKNVSGNCYLSPLVIPVVSSFKRLYKRRLSRNVVFKGKPLHTIEESTELAQNDFNSTNLKACSEIQKKLKQENNSIEDSFEDADLLLQEIRHLFSQNEYQGQLEIHEERQHEHDKTSDEHVLDCDPSYEENCCTECESPSFSLMQHFEMAVKEEAVLVLQNCYRRSRDRQKFLKMRKSAIIIQRAFRRRQMRS